MGFIHVRECLDEMDSIFKKLKNNEELSSEDEIVFDYFELNLAEALRCDWRDCYKIADIILDEDKRNAIKTMRNQKIENPCYDFNLDCSYRHSSGSCNRVTCEKRSI